REALTSLDRRHRIDPQAPVPAPHHTARTSDERRAEPSETEKSAEHKQGLVPGTDEDRARVAEARRVEELLAQATRRVRSGDISGLPICRPAGVNVHIPALRPAKIAALERMPRCGLG